MLERILKIGEPLLIAISKLEKCKVTYFTAEEILVLKDIASLLSVFHEATEKISGESYCTASLIIPIVYCLKDNIDSMNRSIVSETGKLFYCSLIEGIEKRLINYESRTIPQLSTILDPHWKKHLF